MSGFKKRARPEKSPPSTSRQNDTYIAASSTIEGQFTFGGPTIIAGQLKGTIQSTDLLVIEKGAVVLADVIGTNVILKGKLRGGLKVAETLELTATADFEGNVSAATLKVAEGAQFRASMDISRTPAVAPAQAQVAAPVPSAQTPIRPASGQQTPPLKS